MDKFGREFFYLGYPFYFVYESLEILGLISFRAQVLFEYAGFYGFSVFCL